MGESEPTNELAIVARSEPAGIVIDWRCSVTESDLPHAYSSVERFLLRGPIPTLDLAVNPLPERHPHRDEFRGIRIPAAKEMRFIALTMGESNVIRSTWIVEPTAAERRAGSVVAREPLPQLRFPLSTFVVHHFSQGLNSDKVHARGPLVSYDRAARRGAR